MAARDRPPLDWYYLIAEVEAFTERTGWGMARTWGCISAGQYREALLILSECLATEAEGNAGPASPEANRARLRRQIADQERWRADNLGAAQSSELRAATGGGTPLYPPSRFLRTTWALGGLTDA